MGTKLIAQLTFTNVGSGATSTQAHGLNVQNLLLVPDLVQFDNGDFDLVSATTTDITVINNGAGVDSCRVLATVWHTYDRPFGSAPTNYVQQLPNPPFVVRGGGGGSGGSQQAFTYICDGTEGSDFFIPLPVAQPNDNYIVTMTCGGVTEGLAFDCPDTQIGDRTTLQFRVVSTADVQENDRLDVLITQRTA